MDEKTRIALYQLVINHANSAQFGWICARGTPTETAAHTHANHAHALRFWARRWLGIDKMPGLLF